MQAPPRVSIVTATFNRSNVLRHAIASVRAQTFNDWEMLVIGDACTDDTEELVRSFADPRIRFVNLPVNSGDQATPNNEGVLLARGEFVAFLNHDDFWMPDHLSTCVDEIGTGVFVSTLLLYLTADGDTHLSGVCPRGQFHPSGPLPASAWFLRRSFAADVGPWRAARELHNVPSQEWLFRAWRKGHPLRSIPKPTVLAIPSGQRASSYSKRESEIHDEYARLLLEDPKLVERLLLAVALRLTAASQDLSVTRPLMRAARNAVRRGALLFGVHPYAVQLAVRYRRKGGLLDSFRRTRGLPPLPRKGES